VQVRRQRPESAQVRKPPPVNIRKFVVRKSRLDDRVDLGSLTPHACTCALPLRAVVAGPKPLSTPGAAGRRGWPETHSGHPRHAGGVPLLVNPLAQV
jgi:hypothetical protein